MTGMTEFEKLLYQELQDIHRQLSRIREDIGVLKVKSSIFGALGAGVALLIHWGAERVFS